ncbi:MAG: tetratricopeptide repeat protein [Flavobacteriales bacterium]|nr:tetratricopeptide repeat protein [Flavobacteriales bacterium]
MKRTLVTLLIISICSISFGNTQVDSLFQVLRKTKNDSIKANIYELIAINYRESQKDTAFYYNQKAIDFANLTKNYYSIAIAYREYALTAQANDDYPLAVSYYQKALKTFESAKNKEEAANINNDLGVVYYYAGDYEKAKIYFEKSGIQRIEIGDSIGAGQSFNNTGIMCDISGNPTGALKLYIRALTIYENAKDTSLQIGTMTNIGLIYFGQKNYVDALKIYEKQQFLAKKINNKKLLGVALSSAGTALDMLNKLDEARKSYYKALELFVEINDKPMIAQCYTNLSANYDLTNEDDKSLDYALKSIQIKKEIGSMGKIAVSQISAAKIYFKKGNYSLAKKYYNEALTNATNTNYVEYIIKSHQGLYKTFEKLGDFKSAFHHQNNYILLNDSVTNKDNAEMISEMEKKFQSEKKEKEIALLNKTNEIKDIELAKAGEESKRKSIQLYGAIAIGFVLLIFVGVVVRNNRLRKKANLLLAQKNAEILHQKNIVEEKNKEISDSITYAKRIQEAILPSRFSLTEHLKNGFVFYKPKDIVSGDFYWLEKHKESIYFAAADCTGHGVPGAMVSVVCANALSKALLEENQTETGKLLDRTRELVVERFTKNDENVKDGMDISLCRISNNQLQWSGANNPLWIIRKNGKEVEEIKANKQPIGKSEGYSPFTSHEVELNTGDTIYIFTDGFADQFGGEKGKKFMYKQLKELLLSNAHLEMNEQREKLNQAFITWQGSQDQVDDVCVIGVRA